METKTYLDQAGLIKVLGLIKETFVEKETGKSLISDELITKLQGIAAGAQVNVIESVSVNGVEMEITDKGVNIIVPTKISDLGAVTESDLSTELAEKVNASAEGNHSHSNKDVLDGITAQNITDWNDAVSKEHEHANKAELDLIATGDKAKWDQAVTDLASVTGRVAANETAIGTLNGNSSVEGSVDYKIAAEFNKFMANMTNDGTVNTYKELIDYAATHGTEFTELVGEVDANTKAIATLNGDASTVGSVDKKIADAISGANLSQYAKAADLTAEVNRATAAEQANATAAATAQAAAEAAQADVDAIKADYVKASELVALTDEQIDEIWANA